MASDLTDLVLPANALGFLVAPALAVFDLPLLLRTLEFATLESFKIFDLPLSEFEAKVFLVPALLVRLNATFLLN